MFTPKELLYINTLLNCEERGIWVRNDCQDIEVNIKKRGKYVLEFENQAKAIAFEQRILNSDKIGMSMANGVILINKNEDCTTITIRCGQNKEFANRLTKYLRKQYVLNVRQILKERASQEKPSTSALKQEIEDMGLKF